jgi:antitoxin PrlF
LEIEATITSRGQTTVPAAIRKAPHVDPSGSIVFRLENGQVTLTKRETPEAEPDIDAFLSFLTADMMARPGNLRPVTAEWLNGLREPVEGVEVDLNAPLPDDDE